MDIRRKWIFYVIYRPPKQDISYFLQHLYYTIDFYSLNLGDFNVEPDTSGQLSDLLDSYEAKNLITGKTCYKSAEGRCIDLMLTNQKASLMKTDAFETGLSDHHLMIYGMFKSKFSKIPPKEFMYRNYKCFNEDQFLEHLWKNLTYLLIEPENNYKNLETIFVNTLNMYAPLKKKVIRGNSKPHFDKHLRKEIMKRSRLRNVANKTKALSDVLAYKKQRNIVVKMNRQRKYNFFSNINPMDRRKSLWNICGPYFNGKRSTEGKILLLDSNATVSDDEMIANIFNEYFCNITRDLPIQVLPCHAVDKAISRYANHPSILKIKDKCNGEQRQFEFSHVNETQVKRYILALDKNKGTSGAIKTSLLQASSSICSPYIVKLVNSAIDNSIFPSDLKKAVITPLHKSGDPLDKSNYRPISLLPAMSKVFERILYDQINDFFQDIFSPLLCGFRKGYSTQHALLNLIGGKWQECLDEGGVVGTV